MIKLSARGAFSCFASLGMCYNKLMLRYDYEAEKKKLYSQNLSEVMRATRSKWLRLKVRLFSEKFDFREKEVIGKIKRDKILAANFIKDPGRQNFYQSQALKFLNSMSCVKSAIQLPAAGKNALFIINGKLGKKSDFKKRDLITNKSLDFKIMLTDGTIILASHKYTKDSGGAQDNQKNDLITFIQNAKHYKGSEYTFMTIADGDFYQQKSIQEELRLASGGKVSVCSMETFETTVAELAQKETPHA